MAKITEYERALSFDSNDVLLKDGSGGTKIIRIEDAVNYFNENLDDPKNKLPLFMHGVHTKYDSTIWSLGTFSVTTGSNISSTTRLRTNNFISNGVVKIQCHDSYECGLYVWDKNGYAGGWTGNGLTKSTSGGTLYTQSFDILDIIKHLPQENAPYRIKVVFREVTSRDMDIQDSENIVFTCITDSTLSESGTFADSKAVGDELSPIERLLDSGEMLDPAVFPDYSANGITLAWNDDKTECTANGNYTGANLYLVIKSANYELPMRPGHKYKVTCDSTAPNHFFATVILLDAGGTYAGQISMTKYNNQIIEIPYKATYQDVERDISVARISVRAVGNHDFENDVISNISVRRVFNENYYGPDDMIAPENIQANKFFMLGSMLFLSTTAIASGDTLIPETNCTQLTLSDALNLLYTN